jgi:predicted peptidase
MKQQEIRTPGQLSYLLYEPMDVPQPYPLILFLHGAGERGSDLSLLLRQELPKKLERDTLPFLVVSPQCPGGEWWTQHLSDLSKLLDHLLQSYPVDAARVYLTGISMGGFGSWYLGCKEPERFAAVAPICGGGPVSQACALKEVPVWAFHGDQDDIVPPEATLSMIDALRACSGDPKMTPKLTIYPGVTHNSWTRTYNNPELYRWFLSHRKGA